MAEKQAPKNETTYIVLVAHENGGKLTVVGDVEANGPEQAVRRRVADGVGVFVAVPARNWTIVGQQSETPPPVITQTVRKWGEGLPEVEVEGHVVEITPESRGVKAAEKIAAPHPADTIDEEDGA